jgi:hypothetical protein
MRSVREIHVVGAFVAAVAFCLTGIVAAAQYGGGSGTADDPYQIWIPEQMNAIGVEPNDWDKHFKLMADIDLSAYDGQDGRSAFNGIAPDVDETAYDYQGTPFTGVFDGNHHTIAGLTLHGKSYVAMFGQIAPGARVKDLALAEVDVAAESGAAGLAMYNGGVLAACSITGSVDAHGSVAGLVGENNGLMSECHSRAAVSGAGLDVGGLVRFNRGALIRCSYIGAVQGNECVGGLVCTNGGLVRDCVSGGEAGGNASCCGGLVGVNQGLIVGSYSSMAVSARDFVGGLVGLNEDSVCHCFSIGRVSGREEGSAVGGLIGSNDGSVACCYSTGEVRGIGQSPCGLIGQSESGVEAHCFWDKQTSGRTRSAGGWPLTTVEMQDERTYTNAGWDWVGRSEDGTSEMWQMPTEGGYPVLAVFQGYAPPELQGQGTREDPYLISDSRELGAMVHHDPYAHYRLAASIDLSGICWTAPVIPWFAGNFDGNDQTISRLTIQGGGYVGLFGELGRGADLSRLSLTDASIAGSGCCAGVLGGVNAGDVAACSAGGTVTAMERVGGLFGMNWGNVVRSRNAASVQGRDYVGGLIGENGGIIRHCRNAGMVTSVTGERIGGLAGLSYGYIAQCCNDGQIGGSGFYVGGLVGWSGGPIIRCYNTGRVGGHMRIGGLVADNRAQILQCYNAGRVEQGEAGLVYDDSSGSVSSCFWDVEATGATWSDAGRGLTTAEMQDVRTFLKEGWDWVGESENGISEVWWMAEGGGYPVLAAFEGFIPPQLAGSGTPESPYLVSNASELAAVVHYDPDANYRLTKSIDLSGMCWASSVIPWFSGEFDGDGFVVSHLTIKGEGSSGLFGQLEFGAKVSDLGVVDANVTSSGDRTGGLAGWSFGGDLIGCRVSGSVRGERYVGGLIGWTDGDLDGCRSTAEVHGKEAVGGLLGFGRGGHVTQSFSSGLVEGASGVGGLVGRAEGYLMWSCSEADVRGEERVGGLVGVCTDAHLTQCYSRGEAQASRYVGGLIGLKGGWSQVTRCYSSGLVTGDDAVGGLVGFDGSAEPGSSQCFWDIETSGQTTSAGGAGGTTIEMQIAGTYLDAGWDFAGEAANGTEDIWWIDEGRDYPRLWWEVEEKDDGTAASDD